VHHSADTISDPSSYNITLAPSRCPGNHQLSEMSIVSVPVEILEDIVSYLAGNDILKFASTCRAAYACALPSILRDVSLGYHTKKEAGEQLRSFCNCIFADLPQRAPYIRTLTIGALTFPERRDTYSKQDYALTDRVVRIIPLATGLRVLVVDGAERLFSSAPPQITEALTALGNLSEIHLKGYAGPHALRVLSEVQSRPTVVRLTSFDAPTCYLVPGRDRLLHNFTQSLVHLTLVNNHDLVQVLEPHTVWPGVKHLTLGGVRDAASLPALARAFPEVRKLEVYARCTEEKVGRDLWTRLETISFDRPVPLRRPVPHVELVGAEWVEEQFGLALEMMAGMAPTTLTCRDVDPSLDHWAVAQLVKCAARSAKCVRFVCTDWEKVRSKRGVRVGAYSLGGSSSFESWFDGHHFNALGRAPLSTLVVPVDETCTDTPGDENWAYPGARNRLAMLDLAYGIAARISTLLYVGPDVGDRSSHRTRWYKVVSRDTDHLDIKRMRECESREVERMFTGSSDCDHPFHGLGAV